MKTLVVCPKVCVKVPIPTVKVPNAHWLIKDSPEIELADFLIFFQLSCLPPYSNPLLESKHWEILVKYITISTIKTSDS